MFVITFDVGTACRTKDNHLWSLVMKYSNQQATTSNENNVILNCCWRTTVKKQYWALAISPVGGGYTGQWGGFSLTRIDLYTRSIKVYAHSIVDSLVQLTAIAYRYCGGTPPQYSLSANRVGNTARPASRRPSSPGDWRIDSLSPLLPRLRNDGQVPVRLRSASSHACSRTRHRRYECYDSTSTSFSRAPSRTKRRPLETLLTHVCIRSHPHHILWFINPVVKQ